jgi:hypothetical protein
MRCLAETPWIIAGELIRLDCVLQHGHEGEHVAAEMVRVET